MRFAVVGAGIVGLATARELTRRGHTVTVLEREAEVGAHQTGRNSGVVHAGLYYEPGSLKAELCRAGRVRMRDFCTERGLPYDECGKVVVALDESELPALDRIEARARANAVADLRRLDGAGLRAVEPHAAGIAALHSPRTAITDFRAVARALAADLDVRLGFPVRSFAVRGDEVVVGGPGEVVADRVVLCAGLGSDRLARMAGDGPMPVIAPFRGEYWQLVPARSDLVRGLIYPVPDPRYPFLGVHFTRRVDGAVDIGPNAVLHRIPVRHPVPVLRMARANWRAGAHEMAGSLSKRVFVRRAAALLPGLTAADVMPAPPGVRAQAVGADGSLLDDFRISGVRGRVVAVRNAPSPAATSSFAIADYICDHVL